MSPKHIDATNFSHDIVEFLQYLYKYQVDYLVVGGVAVIFYGHARLTGDIDIFYKENIKHGFHIHAPAGGTPKDGPSAGCTFTCAFISRILNKPIKNNIAMTGEIDLMGNVTKIGGLEFKLQGAKKAGVKTVYVSHENEDDINKIKKKYKKLINNDFKVITVKNISDYIDDILL